MNTRASALKHLMREAGKISSEKWSEYRGVASPYSESEIWEWKGFSASTGKFCITIEMEMCGYARDNHLIVNPLNNLDILNGFAYSKQGSNILFISLYCYKPDDLFDATSSTVYTFVAYCNGTFIGSTENNRSRRLYEVIERRVKMYVENRRRLNRIRRDFRKAF